MPQSDFMSTPQVPEEVFEALKQSQAAVDAASGASTIPVQYQDSFQKAAIPAGPLTSPNTVAQLQPKQVGQVELEPAVHAFTADPVVEPASDEPGQPLSVEESIEMLFDLYEDISDRISDLETRIALHNRAASHKI